MRLRLETDAPEVGSPLLRSETAGVNELMDFLEIGMDTIAHPEHNFTLPTQIPSKILRHQIC